MLSSFSYGPPVRQAIVRRIMIFGCALGAVLILLAARMVHPELYRFFDGVGIYLFVAFVVLPFGVAKQYRRDKLYLNEHAVNERSLRIVLPSLQSTFWYSSLFSKLSVLLETFFVVSVVLFVVPHAAYLWMIASIYGFMFWHYVRCLQELPKQKVIITYNEAFVPIFGFKGVYTKHIVYTQVEHIQKIKVWGFNRPLLGLSIVYQDEQKQYCILSRAIVSSAGLKKLHDELVVPMARKYPQDRIHEYTMMHY